MGYCEDQENSCNVYVLNEHALVVTECVYKSHKKKRKKVAQSCLTLCDPIDCSLLVSSVHGIFQARILEWVAISFFRRSSWPRDWTPVFHIVVERFTVWATREVSNFFEMTSQIYRQQVDWWLLRAEDRWGRWKWLLMGMEFLSEMVKMF